MGTLLSSSKKFDSFVFDESAEEEDTSWKKKLKSKFNYSPVDNYTFLEAFAGESVSKGKKARNETVIVDVDDTVKERIVRSDTALQSSSLNHTSKNLSKSICHDPCTSYVQESKNASSSQNTATDRKEPDRSQKFRLTDSELVSIISDDDDDNLSRMSSNDFSEAAGSSGDPIPGQDEISSHEMGPNVVVNPEHVAYGGNCYQVAKLSFFCNFGRLYVSEKAGARDSLILEWKTADIISIESRWLDTPETANICIRIKSEQPKVVTSGQNSGILEVDFSVFDSDWVSTQDKIKSLDAQYMEKWDVDLDSYESFEGITYLEGECDSILISKRDFQLLQPEKFINDTIVDFYVEHLKKIKPADARVHFFNSFFFRKLADFDENRSQSIDAKGAFQRVRKWTKKLNIFQMDYIFIPVNFRLHWSLIVICHPGEVVNFADDESESSLKVPCILHLDSIKGSHRGLEYCIRCYLWEEWKERNNDTAEDRFTKFKNLRFLRVEAPQQQNSYDCALFMLHYMELFVKQAPIYFSPLNNFIDKDWFYPIEASLKRARIKRMIFELAKTNVLHGSSPGCNAKSSYELKDEDDDEADVEILLETCNTKETNCENTSRDNAPIMVEPLRSEPINDDDVDINYMDNNINEEGVQSHCEEFSGSGDNEQDLKQMVLYDPSIDVSRIREIDVTEHIEDTNNQEGVTRPPETNNIDPIVTYINKSLNSLQLRENATPSGDDEVHETLMVEDTDDGSDDDVRETCVLEDDSESDDEAQFLLGIGPSFQEPTTSIKKVVAGNSSNLAVSKRRSHVEAPAPKRYKAFF
uniref:Probable ubiquitin-like-specific protease 2B isoform X1 n=1 Tax=Tanacetum cinerariifolium TaxID=118510 RepID=A0A6L2LR44_TANCI|nr:probable ubiquitin-like-specific protease 2B isoform X1 [Tanacetum cinerariifolium]